MTRNATSEQTRRERFGLRMRVQDWNRSSSEVPAHICGKCVSEALAGTDPFAGRYLASPVALG